MSSKFITKEQAQARTCRTKQSRMEYIAQKIDQEVKQACDFGWTEARIYPRQLDHRISFDDCLECMNLFFTSFTIVDRIHHHNYIDISWN